MMMAINTGCTILLIGFMIFMIAYPIIRKSPQVILCTECQQAKAACPLLSKGCNPIEIMRAAKCGRGKDAIKNSASLCISCGKCKQACPRGLAPFHEVEKWRYLYSQSDEENPKIMRDSMSA